MPILATVHNHLGSKAEIARKLSRTIHSSPNEEKVTLNSGEDQHLLSQEKELREATEQITNLQGELKKAKACLQLELVRSERIENEHRIQQEEIFRLNNQIEQWTSLPDDDSINTNFACESDMCKYNAMRIMAATRAQLAAARTENASLNIQIEGMGEMMKILAQSLDDAHAKLEQYQDTSLSGTIQNARQELKMNCTDKSSLEGRFHEQNIYEDVQQKWSVGQHIRRSFRRTKTMVNKYRHPRTKSVA